MAAFLDYMIPFMTVYAGFLLLCGAAYLIARLIAKAKGLKW
jgi:hypothetical protein